MQEKIWTLKEVQNLGYRIVSDTSRKPTPDGSMEWYIKRKGPGGDVYVGRNYPTQREALEALGKMLDK